MDIFQIVYEFLKENGYDGLCREECGCGLEDLMPCGEPDITHCVQAMKRKATQADIDNGVDCQIGEELYFSAEPTNN